MLLTILSYSFTTCASGSNLLCLNTQIVLLHGTYKEQDPSCDRDDVWSAALVEAEAVVPVWGATVPRACIRVRAVLLWAVHCAICIKIENININI